MSKMSEKLDLEIKEKGPKRKRNRKTLGSYCAAINCQNARRNSKWSMFRFPKDEERCKIWLQSCRREDLRHIPVKKLSEYQLCSNHFEDSQFMNKETKSKLIWNTVPTLFDVPNPPVKVTPSRLVKKISIVAQARTSLKPDKTVKSPSNQPSTSIVEHKCDTSQDKKLKRKMQALNTKLWRIYKQRKLSYKDEVNSLKLQLKNHLLNQKSRKILHLTWLVTW